MLLALPSASVLAGLGVLVYASASLIWSPGDPTLPAIHLASLAGAFALGYRRPDWGPAMMDVYFTLCGVAWLTWMFAGILNPNFVGCMLAVGIAFAITAKYWFFVVAQGLMLYLTGSRGAIIAAGIVGLVRLWSWHKVTALGVILIVILIALTHRSFGESLFNRVGVWQDTIEHLSFWGSGWGSFQAAYTSWPVHRNMTGMIAAAAYNDVLQITFELGIGAVLVWIWLALCLGHAGPGFGLILVAFAACGLSYFPLQLPFIPQAIAFTLGAAAIQQPQERLQPWPSGV